MPQIIDEFVVALGLDPTKYRTEIKRYREDQKKLGQEEQKKNLASEEGQKRLLSGIKTLHRETLGFMFALAGATGIKDFVSSIITGDAETGRFAKNIGLATEQVSAWEGSIKRVGGTSANARQALRLMSHEWQSLQLTGHTAHDADLAGLGVRAEDLKDPEQALLKLAEASKRMPRAEYLERMSRLGIDDNTISFLSKGRQEVERLLGEQRKLGVTTDNDADAAQKLTEELADLERLLRGKLRPIIEEIVGKFTEWASAGSNLNNVIAAAPAILAGLAVALAAANPYATALAVAVGLIVANFEKLKAMWDFFTHHKLVDIHPSAPGSNPNAPKPLPPVPGDEHASAFTRFMHKFIQIHPTSKPKEEPKKPDKPSAIGSVARGAIELFSGSPAGASVPPPYHPTFSGNGSPYHPPKIDSGKGRHVALDGNNPGGINDGDFAKRQPGYVGANGRYAAFDTIEHGERAMRTLLSFYIRHGVNTARTIAARWAPKEDANDPKSYAAQISKRLGIGVNDTISQDQVGAFQYAQGLSENSQYKNLATNQARQAFAAATNGHSSGVQMSSGDVNIHEIKVVTNDIHDGKKVGQDIASTLKQRGLLHNFNVGLAS